MKRWASKCVLLFVFIDSGFAFGQADQITVGPNVHVSQVPFTLRTPTVADALALKSIGRIAASPDGAHVAIEINGGISILSTKVPFDRVKVLTGDSPAWSPNGHLLAFYTDVNGVSQIEVWHPKSDLVEQLTQVPEGISPNLKYPPGYPRSLAWSPDSERIAFCNRRMVGYAALGRRESPTVRVLSADSSDDQVMEGVFRTDHYGGDRPDDLRFRAVARHPELGLNDIFIVDVHTKGLRRLTQSGNQYFFPSWSPDGTKLVAVVDMGRDVETWPSHTALVFLDALTGREQLITTPLSINGPPQWSFDGSEIVTVSQKRGLGFRRIELYLCKEHRWLPIGAPNNMAVMVARWDSDKRSLLVQTYDRFVYTLWRINTATGNTRQIDTHDLVVEHFDQASTGDIFFVASSATFQDRTFMLSVDSARQLQQLYDPNPQLSELQFGQQKRVTWTNKAGDEVDGIIILPPSYQAGKHYPVLVDVYPTPAMDGLRLFADELGQLQAARGYVVFRAALRSPHTPFLYSRDESYNEKSRGPRGIPIMVDDFTSGVEYLVQQGIADPERVGIFGHSNGGWVVNYLITETTVAKCAVVWSGSSSVIYQQYFAPNWAHEVTNGNIYDNFDDYVKMSPLFRMNKVHTPLLMIVGDRDWDTWLPEMLMQFNALKQLGKEVTMVRYANEGHLIGPEDINDFRERVDAFFDEHLRRGQSAAH